MITDFLDTDIPHNELASALFVLREFKKCESEEEYFKIMFAAWAKLEQLQEFLEHLVEGKPLQQDTLDYIAKNRD